MSYRTQVEGNKLIVIIIRSGKADLYQEVDISGSDCDEGGQTEDFVQTTFYQHNVTH